MIVLFAGVDTAGKGETANLLNEWMDPRWIVTRGYTDPSGESASGRGCGDTGAICPRAAGWRCS